MIRNQTNRLIELRLIDVFRWNAMREGYADYWQIFTAGRLGRHRLPDGLADESLPADRQDCARLASQYDIDPVLLWDAITEYDAHAR